MSNARIVFGKPYYNVWNIQQERWWGWKTVGWEYSKLDAQARVKEIES